MNFYVAIDGTETEENFGRGLLPERVVRGKYFPTNEVRPATVEDLVDGILDAADWDYETTEYVFALYDKLGIEWDESLSTDAAFEKAIMTRGEDL